MSVVNVLSVQPTGPTPLGVILKTPSVLFVGADSTTFFYLSDVMPF